MKFNNSNHEKETDNHSGAGVGHGDVLRAEAPQDHVLQHGELLRHHRRSRNQRRRVPSRRCEAVEYGQVRQETPQHGACVVRHRRHRPQLSGGNRRLGDREPLDPGRHRIDAQAPSGTLCDLPLRLARPARRGRGVPLPSGCLQTRRQRRHPRADRLAAQLAHARHRDDVGNDRRRALPLHGRALALAAGRAGGIGLQAQRRGRPDACDRRLGAQSQPRHQDRGHGRLQRRSDRRERRSPSGRQGQDQGVAAGRFLHALRRHAQSRSGNARLPRRMEPLRQYRRFGEPRYRLRRQTETHQGPVQKDQILRQYLQTLLPHPAGGAV